MSTISKRGLLKLLKRPPGAARPVERHATSHPLGGPGRQNGERGTSRLAASESGDIALRRVAGQRLISNMTRPVVTVGIGAVLVFLVFAVGAGGRFTTLNATASWLDQAAELGIVAVPVGILMIAGEFDLSIASVVSAAALTVAIGTGKYGLPLLVSVAIALSGAVLIGLLNGFVTTKTGVPSFIVTLATYFGLAGASLTLTSGLAGTTSVPLAVTGPLHSLLAGSLHQFNASILWCLGVTTLGGYVLRKTVFGNWIQATGGDKVSAREVGVPTDKVKITLFVGSALGAALLGVIQSVEYSGSYVGQGQNFIFDAIVAAVIGGVLLQGGYGSAFGVLLGAITYSIVEVGIQYTSWNSNLAQLFIGVLVLGAVLANTTIRGLEPRSRRGAPRG
jgi:simple sugar transport system permease protein